jgi:superfamily II DNA or RNA helicase
MNTVKSILNNVKPKPIINREITADNPKDPKKRIEILKDLAQEKYFAIVANRVLDEGADVPEAKNCIMLASTGNPKQFIQRRGRVLRKFSDTYPDGSKKEFATIYDILIIPELSDDYTEEEIRIERAIVKSQILRQEMMANIAKNREECLAEIEKIKQKFAL